jgi:hypothetical protein
MLSVWDHDLGPNPDDPLGCAIVPLTELVDVHAFMQVRCV